MATLAPLRELPEAHATDASREEEAVAKIVKKRAYYMHTIDGRPAGYFRPYICFSARRTPLVDSLALIRQQQAAVKKLDAKEGHAAQWVYGYVTVVLP